MSLLWARRNWIWTRDSPTLRLLSNRLQVVLSWTFSLCFRFSVYNDRYSRCQFYQRFAHAFLIRNFYAKNYKALFWLDEIAVVNFINHLRASFSYKIWAPKIQSQKVSRKKLLKDFRTKKAHIKRWWNWLQDSETILRTRNEPSTSWLTFWRTRWVDRKIQKFKKKFLNFLPHFLISALAHFRQTLSHFINIWHILLCTLMFCHTF